MLRAFKEQLVMLYWFPATLRVLWRLELGRLFVFRDEPTEFLRFMLWFMDDLGMDDEDLAPMFAAAVEEVEMRRKRGEVV